MNKPREPSQGVLVGTILLYIINSMVLASSTLVAFFALPSGLGRNAVFGAMLFIIASVLNMSALAVLRKGKLQTIVRSAAIVGNSMFILMAVLALLQDSIMITMLFFGAAAVNVLTIIFAPNFSYQCGKVCPECEYDLRGLKTRGCPECGWERKS